MTVKHTDEIATLVQPCAFCGAEIAVGQTVTVRQIVGKTSSRRRLCETCARADRAKYADQQPASQVSGFSAAQPARSRTFAPRRSLRCTCINCTSGRESLCLRD